MSENLKRKGIETLRAHQRSYQGFLEVPAPLQTHSVFVETAPPGHQQHVFSPPSVSLPLLPSTGHFQGFFEDPNPTSISRILPNIPLFDLASDLEAFTDVQQWGYISLNFESEFPTSISQYWKSTHKVHNPHNIIMR